MTADQTPTPQAPTPRTPEQIAAIHGRNAVEPPDGRQYDIRHAFVAEAALSPDSLTQPDEPSGGAQ